MVNVEKYSVIGKQEEKALQDCGNKFDQGQEEKEVFQDWQNFQYATMNWFWVLQFLNVENM